MDIAPIKSHRDYRRVLKEIEGLMNARRNSPEGDRTGSTIRSTCRTRWKPFDTTWSKVGCSRAT